MKRRAVRAHNFGRKRSDLIVMPRYMIRITIDAFRDLKDAVETLESLGVILDKDFGPVPLDTQGNQFLLRGEVHPKILADLKQAAGVEFFPDPSIGHGPPVS